MSFTHCSLPLHIRNWQFCNVIGVNVTTMNSENHSQPGVAVTKISFVHFSVYDLYFHNLMSYLRHLIRILKALPQEFGCGNTCHIKYQCFDDSEKRN